MELQELLEYLARGLVDRPDEVSVEQFEEEDGTILLELAVAEEDYGKVIGRGGGTVQSLRTLLKAVARGRSGGPGPRVMLDIVE